MSLELGVDEQRPDMSYGGPVAVAVAVAVQYAVLYTQVANCPPSITRPRGHFN